MTCCNHNCNQGRTCPHRIKRALRPAIKETLAQLAHQAGAVARDQGNAGTTGEERGCVMKWQPIETAPKDGTEILCCFDWIDGGEMTVAKYKKTRHGVGYFAPPRSYVQHNFTHWMPLPAPPYRKTDR